MRRHLRYQKRFGFLTIAIVLVILGIVGTIGWYSNHQSKKSESKSQTAKLQYHKPDNPVSAAADSYIIAKVGQDRFLTYFKAQTADIPSDTAEGGIRSYQFSKLRTVTPDQDTVVVIVNIKDTAKTTANLVPDCQKDKSLCDFKVTRAQVDNIAQKNGLDPADLQVSWDTSLQGTSSLAIKVTSCSKSKVLYIDHRKGRVLTSYTAPCPKLIDPFRL